MTRRIYVAYTGGTFGMKATADGYKPDTGIEHKLRKMLPAAGRGGMPHWELHEYERLIDSAEAQPSDWHAIATDLASRYDDYDGFVVIHGTDTMAYTAAALSFALAGLRKPVIVTGAQIPLSVPRSDAAGNLLGALLIAAQHALPEVCLYFNGTLLRGNRATKVSSSSFDAFDSPNHPPLGRVGIDIVVDRHLALPVPAREAFEIVAPGGHEIALLRVHPGLTPAQCRRLLAPPLGGLLLQTYGAGNGPVGMPGFVEALADATARGVVVVNVTQCARGSVDAALYATGSALAEAGVVAGRDLTVEAALTKLEHLLSLGLDADEARRRMPLALCGEVGPPGAAGADERPSPGAPPLP